MLIYCWVELDITPTNLVFNEDMSFKGAQWKLEINGNKVKLSSKIVHTERSLSDESYEDDKHKINQIIGHARNIICFVFGVDVKWGYKSCVGELLSSAYPSIHQQNDTESTSVKFDEDVLKMKHTITKSISKSRKKGVNSMLNYWRRGYELDQLGYDAESFLNYFKVLECLSEVGKGSSIQKKMLDRFTVKQTGKKQALPITSLKKYTFNQIYLATSILAGANYDEKVHRRNVDYILEVINMRHNWGVGHKIFRNNPYDTYSGIGQHSIEFSHVMIENIYLEKMSKYFILRYLKPGKFKLDNSSGMPTIVSA